jgi:hypothetical protein
MLATMLHGPVNGGMALNNRSDNGPVTEDFFRWGEQVMALALGEFVLPQILLQQGWGWTIYCCHGVAQREYFGFCLIDTGLAW